MDFCTIGYILTILVITLPLCAVLGLADKSLTVTQALPNGAASVTSTAFDLESGTNGSFLANVEIEVTIPALTTSQLGDTQTITYILESAAASGFGTIVTLNAGFHTQTGDGGAGDVGATKRLRLPSNVARYVRVKATKTGASNASTANMTVKLLQLM